MRRLLRVTLVIPVVAAIALTWAAPAEAQQDEMCGTFQGFIDQGNAQGPPFSDMASQGQELKDAGCEGGGGAPPLEPPEGGGDNPLCGPFRSLLDQGHAAGGPFAELAAGGEDVYAGACGGTTPTTAPAGDGDDDDDDSGDGSKGGGDDVADDVAEVLGETASNSGAGGSALPRTGGPAAAAAFALTGAGAALAALRRRLRP